MTTTLRVEQHGDMWTVMDGIHTFVVAVFNTRAEAEQYITDLRWKRQVASQALTDIEPVITEYRERFGGTLHNARYAVLDLMWRSIDHPL